MGLNVASTFDEVLDYVQTNASDEIPLQWRNIGDKEMEKLLAVLRKQPIKSLHLSGCNMTTDNVVKLIRFLESESGLQHLDLFNNRFGDEGMNECCKFLSTNSSLLTINLTSAGATTASCPAVADMLRNNFTLTTLKLNGNELRDDGGCLVADAMSRNSTLEELQMSFTSIGDRVAQTLAAALKTNKTLKHVNLSGNQITDLGGWALADGINSYNSRVMVLDLSRNKVVEANLKETLRHRLSRNKELVDVPILTRQIQAEVDAVRADLEKEKWILASRSQSVDPDIAPPSPSVDLNKASSIGGATPAKPPPDVYAPSPSPSPSPSPMPVTPLSIPMGKPPIENLPKLLTEMAFQRGVSIEGKELGDTGARTVAEKLQKTNWERVKLVDCNVGDGGCRAIANAFRFNNQITFLSLANNLVGDDGAIALSRVLVGYPAIESLYLQRNQITLRGALSLGNSLKGHPKLTVLELSNNDIGDEGARSIAQCIARGPLETLDLSSNNISDDGAKAISISLKSPQTSLRHLFLYINNITDEGSSYIADSLALNNKLEDLNLSLNKIGDNGACHLVDGLSANRTLKRLYIRQTDVGAAGALAAEKFLAGNRSLEVFDASGNQSLGLQGLSALSRVFATNHLLQRVDLQLTAMTDDACTVLAQSLRGNMGITSLDLSDNELSDLGVVEIAKSLNGNHNSKLQKLLLYGNRFSDPAATELAALLTHNSKIKELNISFSDVGDVGGEKLLEALNKNITLTSFSVSHSKITMMMQDELMNAVEKNKEIANAKENVGTDTPHSKNVTG